VLQQHDGHIPLLPSRDIAVSPMDEQG